MAAMSILPRCRCGKGLNGFCNYEEGCNNSLHDRLRTFFLMPPSEVKRPLPKDHIVKTSPAIPLAPEQLKAIAPNAIGKAIEVFLPYINKYASQYEINTLQRMASFLAQVLHESGALRFTRELWGPTRAQLLYERDFSAEWPPHKRTDRNWKAYHLGNEHAGDGKKYKGHGLIQVTGRANHLWMSVAMFGDAKVLLQTPELLTTPENAVRSAFIYWQRRNINALADTEGIADETRAVNGGLNGLTHRQQYYDRAIEVLG